MIVKAVNLILARGLDYLQFRQFLSDTHAEFEDLTYCCNIRWLSREKMLHRMNASLEESATYFES